MHKLLELSWDLDFLLSILLFNYLHKLCLVTWIKLDIRSLPRSEHLHHMLSRNPFACSVLYELITLGSMTVVPVRTSVGPIESLVDPQNNSSVRVLLSIETSTIAMLK